jgi:hypothetical protein
MAHSTTEHNPFMLLVHPELVLAAVEKSERLGQLNRHLCRPLDRPVGGQTAPAGSSEDGSEDDIVESGFQTQ